jgi:hypothetical protein
MKQLFAVLLLFVSTFAFGQIQSEKITVDTKDLPPELVTKIKEQQKVEQVTQQLESYGKWAGVGKEIGVAVRDGLTAVKDVAIDFSKTDVGMFTMVLIAWKVVGEDVSQLLVGLLIFFSGLPILIWSWRKLYKAFDNKRVLVEDQGWFRAKKYEVVKTEYRSDDALGWGVFVHVVALFALIGITSAIIF